VAVESAPVFIAAKAIEKVTSYRAVIVTQFIAAKAIEKFTGS